MISSYILSNTLGNAIAMFDKTFLSNIIFFSFIDFINWLYLFHFSLSTAESLSIHNFLKSLFFSFLAWYECCPCFTRASLTCLYTFFLPNLNHLASLINFLCLLCLCNQFVTLTIVIYKGLKLWFSYHVLFLTLFSKDSFYWSFLCLLKDDCYMLYRQALFFSSLSWIFLLLSYAF